VGGTFFSRRRKKLTRTNFASCTTKGWKKKPDREGGAGSSKTWATSKQHDNLKNGNRGWDAEPVLKSQLSSQRPAKNPEETHTIKVISRDLKGSQVLGL